MKLFRTSQIRSLDQYTIEHEPIASIALMERAADRMLQQFKKDWSINKDVVILAGPGNNGGDGLALGRMLLQIGYDVQVVLLHSGKLSADCKQNRERILELFPDFFSEQLTEFTPVELSDKTIIVDALFGSGLTHPLDGMYADAVRWINNSGKAVVAIDIPSGLEDEGCCTDKDAVIVKADLTYTLQFPKLAFLLPENEHFVGKWKVIDIQLHPKAIEKTESDWSYIEKTDIQKRLKSRSKFAHKGNFGHVLLVAGSKGMTGAAVLSSSAALRTGAGLVTVFGAEENRTILQSTVPEAIYITDAAGLDKYSVLAFGPGIGTSMETEEILKEILRSNSFSPLNKRRKSSSLLPEEKVSEGRMRLERGLGGSFIFDADALNIISKNPDFWNIIPKKSIITPHPKEFERLFGESENSLQRFQKARQKAQELGIIIVLKGAYTAVFSPEGQIYFNSTGNPGMASGGMGDVLTGMIAGLLAQNYFPLESALIGVYLHGLSADLALENQSQESLIARDVIAFIGKGYHFLRK